MTKVLQFTAGFCIVKDEPRNVFKGANALASAIEGGVDEAMEWHEMGSVARLRRWGNWAGSVPASRSGSERPSLQQKVLKTSVVNRFPDTCIALFVPDLHDAASSLLA